MDDSVTLTIIIPVKPGGAVRALGRLRDAVYPAAGLEVLVAEGRRPSRQRNRAASLARGDILYFLDDDSLADPGSLQRAVRHFADPSVAAVGGPSLTPDSDSLLQRAIGIALASPFGGGGARNRYRKTGTSRPTSERELILCNLAFRRELFLELGGLDERLYPNEENELMDRVMAQGGRLIHDPDLAVQRSQRPTFRAFVRQFLGYGRGRGEQTRISGFRGWVDFAPSLFLLYLSLLPLAPKAVCFLPLLCYGAAVILSAVAASAAAGLPSAFPLLLVLFPALHLSYGAGLLKGLVVPRYARNRGGGEQVTIRTVKAMGEPWPHGETGEEPL
ncbi:MAG: glycosyltransferase [Desulfuromonadales bacterium]|nr:MAG: glycosyltransferase [Desulfuromonadales bacterium]